MGMYTEVYINCDLKEDTPEEVVNTLYAMVRGEDVDGFLEDKPHRWSLLFRSSAYFTDTIVGELRYNNEAWHTRPYYTLHGKGAIKNYNSEIQSFFEWIKPWAEQDFIGYYLYEEDREPTLVYANNRGNNNDA